MWYIGLPLALILAADGLYIHLRTAVKKRKKRKIKPKKPKGKGDKANESKGDLES